jgi:hypothetical protein
MSSQYERHLHLHHHLDYHHFVKFERNAFLTDVNITFGNLELIKNKKPYKLSIFKIFDSLMAITLRSQGLGKDINILLTMSGCLMFLLMFLQTIHFNGHKPCAHLFYALVRIVLEHLKIKYESIYFRFLTWVVPSWETCPKQQQIHQDYNYFS